MLTPPPQKKENPAKRQAMHQGFPSLIFKNLLPLKVFERTKELRVLRGIVRDLRRKFKHTQSTVAGGLQQFL
jgi:hypothetical protein